MQPNINPSLLLVCVHPTKTELLTKYSVSAIVALSWGVTQSCVHPPRHPHKYRLYKFRQDVLCVTNRHCWETQDTACYIVHLLCRASKQANENTEVNQETDWHKEQGVWFSN